MSENRTLAWEWYVEPHVLAEEQKRIFGRSWQYVGHVGMLPEAEGFFPSHVGGVPLVITRDAGSTIRALVNVCRHRGAVVCPEQGTGGILRCPYHAWTYALDGALRGAPRSERESLFDPQLHGLASVPLGRWGPFLFASPTQPKQAFAEWIDPICRRVADALDVDDLVFSHRWEGTYRANWKVCVENFLECYHCRVAHPAFSSVIDTGPDDYELIAEDSGSTQYGPVRRGWSGPFDPMGPITRGQFHVLYPNTAINIMPGHANLSIGPVRPIGSSETHRYLDYFFGPDVPEAWIAEMLQFDDQVGAEDRPLVESVQRGMESGVHDHGTLFLDSERLIAHFRDFVRAGLTGCVER